MSKIRKKDSKVYFNEVKKFIIEELCGVIMGQTYDGSTEYYELETIVGEASITLNQEQSYTYSLFCRFTDVDRAFKKFTCNKFSGKYNLNVSSIPVETAIEVAKGHLERMTIAK